MERHGYKNTRLYNVWALMKNRCHCKTSDNYKNYGARGIEVCEEWRYSFLNFHDWAIKNGYDENAKKGQCTLDRINVNGNYCPENCRFVDMHTQGNNTRFNRNITYKNKTQTLTEWARELGLEVNTIRERFERGLPIEDVLYKGYLREKKIKPILQLDLDGNLIKRWNCCAGEIGKNSEFCARNILYCVNGKYKTHKKYQWRYEDENISD